MNKPSQERIERAAQVHREVCRLGAGIENREETVTAILTADDSHLAAENERLRKLLGEAEGALATCKVEKGFYTNLIEFDYVKVSEALTKIRAEREGE